jgi:hypothetical protein
MVQIAIGRCRQLECPEADVVEGLIIDAESLIRIFDQLMDGERCVVGLTIDQVISKRNQEKSGLLFSPQRRYPTP